MADIQVLSKHLVSKIAAGEVIERPASVVKELVENALDAGASAVDVTVEDGGRRLIAVRDNGAGMGPDDLELAFAPHATSKIGSEEDLFNIHTMGFRGEALASIAAVSQASIVSRRRSDSGGAADESGYEVRVDGQGLSPVRPCAAPAGTTVTVRNLFYNTPARRKFMRTANTEFGHVVEALARLALPHCQVAFTLTHNSRSTHSLPAADSQRRRVADFFGAELAASLIEFASDEHELRIFGLIAPPRLARASGRWQYFFVNGRYVRDRFLGHALREAYRGMVEPSRSPVAFVFLEMDPAGIDVNVHPAKIEVRFRSGQLVHSQLLGSIRETLNKADVAPAVEIDALPAGDQTHAPEDARRQSLKQALAEFFKSTPPPQPRLEFPRPGGHRQQREVFRGPAPLPADGDVAKHPPARARPAGEAAPEAPTLSERAPHCDAIQLHNSYIVTATEDGLAIIDQHALHERVLFEDLSRRLAAGPLAAQRLLIPEAVEVSEADKAALSERADLLGRLGVEVSEFGPHSVAVQSFPALLANRKVPIAAFLRDLLDLLAERSSSDGEELLDRVIATMACKAAVKAGEPLTAEEINALLAKGSETQRSASCPHGRPTTLTLTLQELEKQFKRT